MNTEDASLEAMRWLLCVERLQDERKDNSRGSLLILSEVEVMCCCFKMMFDSHRSDTPESISAADPECVLIEQSLG